MNFQAILRHRAFLPATVGVVAFGSGVAAGWYIGKERVLSKLRVRIEEEVIETVVAVEEEFQIKLFEEVIEDDGKVNIVPMFKKNDPKENHPSNGTRPKTEVEAMVETLETNIFEQVIEGWDYDAELVSRNELDVYIIHRDEFYGDELSWDNQHALTWYEGDNILTTEADDVIYNPQAMVGELKFGHGSGDPNVCFIRNERLHAEYEVTRNPGSYDIEVLGGQIEAQLAAEDLKHSRSPGKFPRD